MFATVRVNNFLWRVKGHLDLVDRNSLIVRSDRDLKRDSPKRKLPPSLACRRLTFISIGELASDNRSGQRIDWKARDPVSSEARCPTGYVAHELRTSAV